MNNIKEYVIKFLEKRGYYKFNPLKNEYNVDVYAGGSDRRHADTRCTIQNREESTKLESGNEFLKGILHLYFNDSRSGIASGSLGAVAEITIIYNCYTNITSTIESLACIDITPDKHYKKLFNEFRCMLENDEMI